MCGWLADTVWNPPSISQTRFLAASEGVRLAWSAHHLRVKKHERVKVQCASRRLCLSFVPTYLSKGLNRSFALSTPACKNSCFNRLVTIATGSSARRLNRQATGTVAGLHMMSACV
jgi:hypothetical protein